MVLKAAGDQRIIKKEDVTSNWVRPAAGIESTPGCRTRSANGRVWAEQECFGAFQERPKGNQCLSQKIIASMT
jgi:hypothetical protein